MRKRVIVVFVAVVVVLIAVFFLVNKQTIKKNKQNEVSTIQIAELPDETNRIVKALGNNVYVFDLNQGEAEQPVSVHTWVEVFEKGVQKKNLFDLVSEGSNDQQEDQENEQEEQQKKNLIYSIDFDNIKKEKKTNFKYIAAIVDEGGSSNLNDELSFPGEWGGHVFVPMLEKRDLSLDQPVTLLAIVEDDGDSIGVSTSEINQYDQKEETPQNLMNYDRVLLFRVMLENPEDTANEQPEK